MRKSIVTPTIGTPTPFNQAIVVVDYDTNAERVVIYDRQTLAYITSVNVAAVTPIKVRLPDQYGTSNRLLIGILDDGGEYNAAFADGVSAEIIDGNVMSIR